MENKLYRNRKNDNLYMVLDEAIDCTNERDGLKVIIYSPIGRDAVYVREEQEFLEKFMEVKR